MSGRGGAAEQVGDQERKEHTRGDAPIVSDDESVPEGAERAEAADHA
jgi:hypothetical protein